MELRQFLHQYTEVEKLLISVLTNDSSDETVPPELKKTITDYLEHPDQFQVLKEEMMLLNSGEKLSFFLHPRIFETFGIEVKEHRHSFIELVYVYSGKCYQTIEGVQMTLNEGDICILDTRVSHSVTIADHQDIVINCLMNKSYFDTAFLGRLSGNDVLSDFFIRAIYQDKSKNEYILFRSGSSEPVRLIMENILCEFYDSSMCSAEVINAYMIILFSELLRVYKKEINNRSYPDLRYTKISDIILYLQQNYKSTTLTSAAKHFNFDPAYLSTIFKQITGVGFKDFLQQSKLERACTLLRETDFTIEAVAYEVGYLNMSFFYRLFKEHYGMTPHEYRRKQNLTS
jgi:AraC-like DNA-binding protein/mannose-6-phosphate isomerase-like protein (cupin superfamily)